MICLTMIRHLMLRFRMFQRRLRQFVIHNVLHADDPPHRLALGIAIGVFVAFTPTIGFQMVLAVFLAWLLGANKIIGAALVWISNPATIVPIYYPCYVVGRFICDSGGVSFRWWRELGSPPEGWWDGVVFYWNRFTEIAVPLWVGCLLVAINLGYLSYRASLSAICIYRMKRWGQLMPPLAKPKRHGHGVPHDACGD